MKKRREVITTSMCKKPQNGRIEYMEVNIFHKSKKSRT